MTRVYRRWLFSLRSFSIHFTKLQFDCICLFLLHRLNTKLMITFPFSRQAAQCFSVWQLECWCRRYDVIRAALLRVRFEELKCPLSLNEWHLGKVRDSHNIKRSAAHFVLISEAIVPHRCHKLDSSKCLPNNLWLVYLEVECVLLKIVPFFCVCQALLFRFRPDVGYAFILCPLRAWIVYAVCFDYHDNIEFLFGCRCHRGWSRESAGDTPKRMHN